MLKRPLLLVTDFGSEGPYLGQMRLVFSEQAPGHQVIDLLSNAPLMRPASTAYLIAALADVIQANSIFIAVVDPGVGGPRSGLVLQTERHWYIGPDNGLLALAARRADRPSLWRIDDKPEVLSNTFHGRDLFAPVAAQIARGEWSPSCQLLISEMVGADWAPDLPEVIYIDHYGNAFTGVRASSLGKEAIIEVGCKRLSYAATFSDVGAGCAFWYENSCGLVELAVNLGRADQVLGVKLGDAVNIVDIERE